MTKASAPDSASLLRALFDGSPDGIVIARTDGSIVAANARVRAIFGWDDSVIGRFSGELGVWVDPDGPARLFEAVNAIGRVEGYEAAFVMPDGQRRVVELSAHIADLDGEPCLVIVARDVTEDRAHRSRLERLVAEYRATMRIPGTAFIVFDHDLRFQVVEGPGMAGVEPLVGRTLAEIQPDPERRAVVERAYRAALAGEEAELESNWSGRVYWSRLAPIRSSDGEVVAGVILSWDITERRAAEAALVQSEHLFRTLADNAPVGIFRTDASGDCIYVNPRWVEITGLAAKESMGRGWLDAIHPDHRSDVAAEWYSAALEGREFQLEFRLRDRDDEERWVAGKAAAVRSDGAIVGYVGTDQDITAQRRAEEDRRALDRAVQHAQKLESLGLLAGGVAHDFNNLLVSVLGNASLARGEIPVDWPAQHTLDEIEVAARRAGELAGQMLAYSGRGRFVISPIDLGDLVSEMSDLLRASIRPGARLRVDLSTGLPPVEADATQLRQVVLNLILNASESLPVTGGEVTVRTYLADGHRPRLGHAFAGERHDPSVPAVCLEVSDTGNGMDEATIGRMFDPFFTTKPVGRGLGLAAVIGIIRGHHGAIELDSEVGVGTVVRVVLPIAPASAGPAIPTAWSDPRVAGAWSGSGRILVVDDEPGVCRVAQRMLERIGFEVVVAPDGPTALERFRPGEFRAVLLDLTLPGIGGDQVFARIRELEPELPIVLSSGWSEQEVRTKVGQGPALFLGKPFRLEELIAVFRLALHT